MSVKKVLLVNPPWITRDANVWHDIKSAMPPLSLLSIVAALDQGGFEVEINVSISVVLQGQILLDKSVA
jgi:hypothetical protein